MRASRRRAVISPARRSAAALMRTHRRPAWETSRPARVKTAKRRRFGRAALRCGGRPSDFSALKTF